MTSRQKLLPSFEKLNNNWLFMVVYWRDFTPPIKNWPTNVDKITSTSEIGYLVHIIEKLYFATPLPSILIKKERLLKVFAFISTAFWDLLRVKTNLTPTLWNDVIARKWTISRDQLTNDSRISEKNYFMFTLQWIPTAEIFPDFP